MNNSVLVTGATGFIGSYLCQTLDRKGWKVTGFKHKSPPNGLLDDHEISWESGDILRPKTVTPAIESNDYVVHLAGASIFDGQKDIVRRVNVDGTANILKTSLASNVNRVILVSTAGTRRVSNGMASEQDLAKPIGSYQESKLEAESIAHEYSNKGLDIVIVHPTSVFGPRDSNFTARLLKLVRDPKMFAYLPGGASFVSVRDVAAGIIAAMTRGNAGEHYILGGENLTYKTALEIISQYSSGYSPPVKIPAQIIHGIGLGVGPLNSLFGSRIFPVNRQMAQLVTKKLFYSSVKARDHLGYSFMPFSKHVSEAIDWYNHYH